MQTDLKSTIEARLREDVGPWPDCERCLDWCQFANMLGCRINISAIYKATSKAHGKQLVKEWGSCAAGCAPDTESDFEGGAEASVCSGG